MNEHWFSRTQLLIGDAGCEKLKNSHVLIAGLGGVGSWAAEFICRAGVGKMTIIDHDVVNETNLNRQLVALTSTIKKPKTEVMRARILDINPNIELNIFNAYLKDELTPNIIKQVKPDYIIDAIDTLSPKVFLIHFAVTHNFKIVSSLGAGGRLAPEKITVTDISQTKNCRLAFYIRKRLRKLGISSGFKVVFSTELVNDDVILNTENESNKKSTVGTISYIPAIFGGFCASVVINDLLK